MADETRLILLEQDITDSWLRIFERVRKLSGLKDELAMVRASNGILVGVGYNWKFEVPFDTGFKTGQEIADEKKPEPSKTPEKKPEPPKDEPSAGDAFGTDRWGKVWPTQLVCLNLVPDPESPNKFVYCSGVAKTHRSSDPEKAGSIFAICPKCNHFLKHDGRPGRKAEPQPKQ